MPHPVYLIRPVKLSRSGGTIEIKGTGGAGAPSRGKKLALPVLQVSEIYALAGAEAEGPLLALLCRHGIPLHLFEEGWYRGSWMPAWGVLSGQVTVAQYTAFGNPDLRFRFAKELLRGAVRLRYLAAKARNPRTAADWESTYFRPLSAFYAEGISGDRAVASSRKSDAATATVAEIRAADQKRRREDGWDEDSLRIVRGLCRALVLGSFARLSLDPARGVLCQASEAPPLAEDLFFLLEPLLVDFWPPEERPLRLDEEAVEVFKRHGTRVAARDGGRLWSLRSLAVREGYHLLAAVLRQAAYRAALRVEALGPC